MLISGFDYQTYLSLAKELAVCDASKDTLHQAKIRSSISRAYYAAFLSAKRYHPEVDVRHGDLIAWVKKRDRDVADFLKELKTFREDCDYDRRIGYDLGNKAQECCDISQEIIDRLDSLFERDR